MDDIFVKLPAPKPSAPALPSYGGYRGAQSSAKRSAPVSMSSYYNCSNPCFDGHNRALLADGSSVLVKDLKQGDEVLTPNGPASIVCIVKTLVGPETELCQVGDLLLTPWHPIMHEGAWTFPNDVAEQKTVPCEAVYSFVLD